jgi:glycosyltransferase involved in cell wall biosynthesis
MTKPIMVKQVIVDIKPDIIHSHFGPNSIRMNNLFKDSELEIPHVISFHGTDINSLPDIKRGYLEQIHELGEKKNTWFVAPSQFLKNKMVKRGIPIEKISVIRNSFNQTFLEVKKNEKFESGNKLKFINVGRLESVKGQKYLIEAFSKFINIYSNSHLTIIGEGSLERKLKDAAKNCGIENKIQFLGSIPHQNIPKYLALHDVYIQPSIVTDKNAEENSPISVLEAMAVGLPVVASNIGGLKEIIENKKNGFLVPPESSDDIFKCMNLFIKNPKLIEEMGSYARNYVQNNYSSVSQCQAMISLYEEIIHEQNP